MLSLKEFKSQRITSLTTILGGTEVTSHSSYGTDYIHDGVMITEDGDFLGCGCSNGTTFSDACCDE